MNKAQNGLDLLSQAYSCYRRHKFDDAVEICTTLLAKNSLDQAAFVLKCRAANAMVAVDRTDIDEEVAGDTLLDRNAATTTARVGTTYRRTSTAARPVTKSGRPVTGFMRPGTQNRMASGRRQQMKTATARAGTARPVTSGGRVLRLGTASLATLQREGQIELGSIDPHSYASKPYGRILADYLIDVSGETSRATELASTALGLKEDDVFWCHRHARALYNLGLLQEAETAYKRVLQLAPSVSVFMEAARIPVRRDQPLAAKELYDRGLAVFPGSPSLILGKARVEDTLGNEAEAEKLFKAVIRADPTNLEAIASYGANAFYSSRYELALQLFTRLVHMDAAVPAVWNNLALCYHHICQPDLALQALQRALLGADSDATAAVWYNTALVALALGEHALARDALHCTLQTDPAHTAALNCLGVLELQQGNDEAARQAYMAASEGDGFEPHLNQALLAYKTGRVEKAFELVKGVLEDVPGEEQATQLEARIKEDFLL
ncbi:trp protein for ciliary function [Carpediemonas membranifera]|uniref:Trp protein for ciliary function n=1 Tax=Carpediemonas membranifera TaxID=201153 RepID=A0A8J6BBK6_9EUKA|nr:trp protein for ciliary function [Carpediemonas membranifera]|eukprot:KAG9397334.1 trp protein for ciliary function [Carpediemonas membranifera]